MTKYLIVSILVLMLALLVMTKINATNEKEKERLQDNQEALLSDARFYKTRDSLSAASVQRLSFSSHELQQHRQELSQIIQSLDIKVTRVKTASSTSVKSQNRIKTVVRDSILILEAIPYTTQKRIDTLKCINYQDRWLTFSGCQDKNEFVGIIESRNTIDQIVHRVPRKFLFFRWGTKAIRQEVVSRNPNSVITFTEYIELKK